MSTTVKYEGNEIATVENETVTLATAGTYMTDNLELTDVTGNVGTLSVAGGNFERTISFEVEGEPIALTLIFDSGMASTTSTTNRKIIAVVYDGTNCYMYYIIGTGATAPAVNRGTCTYSYANGTVTLTAFASYYFNESNYTVVYTYRS